MLLVLDNLVGHHTPSFVRWYIDHGIMLLYTPPCGSWLNMAESIQRILKRRTLAGAHLRTPEEIMMWLNEVRRAGIAIQRHSSGAANVLFAGHAAERDSMRRVVQDCVRDAQFGG